MDRARLYHVHLSGVSRYGRSVVKWHDGLVLVALKEADHAYEITGLAQGIRNDLTVEIWRPDRQYIETVGVNATAKRMGSHVPDDNPEVYQ